MQYYTQNGGNDCSHSQKSNGNHIKERKKERKKAINKERNLKKAKRKRLKDRDRTSNYYIAGNGSF